MLGLHERWVLHLQICLNSSPENAPRVPFSDLVVPLASLIDNEEAVHISEKGTKAVRARAYHIDDEEQVLTLLVNYADMNLADPAFEHLERGDVRIAEKEEGEGIAVSTHMAIDLRPAAPGAPFFNAVLEDVPGIGRTKLEPFLTYLFRQMPRFEYELDDGKVRRFRPKADLDGFMAATLQDDLARGVLSSIELVQHRADGGEFDEEGLLKEERRSVLIDVERRLSGRDAVEVLNRLKGQAQNQGFTNMKVTWNRNEGRQKSRDFGTAREDVSDVLTIGTTHTRYEEAREQCEVTVREDVRERLTEIIKSQRNE